MNNLTSKLQYKTYEKGEFSDEQSRSLEETLALIKAFPWDTQRGVDVQASGPGVVIKGVADHYLKVAIYYNSKFTVYYLDAENHLYEFHTSDLEIADQKVADFYNNTLSLADFEKHFFNIGNRNHFLTRNFEYHVTFQNAMLAPMLAGIFMLFLSGIVIKNTPLFIIILTIGSIILIVILVSLRFNNNYLKISKGHDEFWFGEDELNIKCYNKQDIKEVVIIQSGRRSFNDYSDTKLILFKDSSIIRIPGLLISTLAFIHKFKDELVHIERKTLFNTWYNKKAR